MDASHSLHHTVLEPTGGDWVPVILLPKQGLSVRCVKGWAQAQP